MEYLLLDGQQKAGMSIYMNIVLCVEIAYVWERKCVYKYMWHPQIDKLHEEIKAS